MAEDVRVRYAPSPTGLQHIGGIRTALFNYFFAKSRGGAFVLRIEDTDQARFDAASLQDIYDTFDWLGVSADEGPRQGGAFAPYVQSERRDLYVEHAGKLVDSGHAYYDYSSKRSDHEEGKPYRYEGRHMSQADIDAAQAAGVEPVVRLLVPTEGSTEFEDLVLGRIRRKNKDVPPDPVLLKSDGLPTYHLANVVDDHHMGITHVLRAQEWVPSTPIHLLLYRAFGWEPPRFCHLPMVMGKDGQKLSKRHGSTSVVDFRAAGYLPEALLNYVSLLGWSYDDSREFFTLYELERLFDTAKLNKAPAVFDYKKLDWFNGQYIRELDDTTLLELLIPYLAEAGRLSDPPSESERAFVMRFLPIVKERLRVLSDVVPLTAFLYDDVDAWTGEDLIPKKTTPAEARAYLSAARNVIAARGAGDESALDEAFHALAEQLGTKLGNVMMPLRVAVTGSRVSPPLIPSIRLLGIDVALRRIDGALTQLEPTEDQS